MGWIMVCFCGDEAREVNGWLYCQNPECEQYLNIVEPSDTSIKELTKDA